MDELKAKRAKRNEGLQPSKISAEAVKVNLQAQLAQRWLEMLTEGKKAGHTRYVLVCLPSVVNDDRTDSDELSGSRYVFDIPNTDKKMLELMEMVNPVTTVNISYPETLEEELAYAAHRAGEWTHVFCTSVSTPTHGMDVCNPYCDYCKREVADQCRTTPFRPSSFNDLVSAHMGWVIDDDRRVPDADEHLCWRMIIDYDKNATKERWQVEEDKAKESEEEEEKE